MTRVSRPSEIFGTHSISGVSAENPMLLAPVDPLLSFSLVADRAAHDAGSSLPTAAAAPSPWLAGF
jgi:hypothetical protein